MKVYTTGIMSRIAGAEVGSEWIRRQSRSSGESAGQTGGEPQRSGVQVGQYPLLLAQVYRL